MVDILNVVLSEKNNFNKVFLCACSTLFERNTVTLLPIAKNQRILTCTYCSYTALYDSGYGLTDLQ